MADVRARLAGAAKRDCVAVDERRVVLGYLPAERLDGAGEAPVSEAMDPAPATIRPSASAEKVLEAMGDGAERILVTTSEGELIGIVHRDAAERDRGDRRVE